MAVLYSSKWHTKAAELLRTEGVICQHLLLFVIWRFIKSLYQTEVSMTQEQSLVESIEAEYEARIVHIREIYEKKISRLQQDNQRLSVKMQATTKDLQQENSWLSVTIKHLKCENQRLSVKMQATIKELQQENSRLSATVNHLKRENREKDQLKWNCQLQLRKLQLKMRGKKETTTEVEMKFSFPRTPQNRQTQQFDHKNLSISGCADYPQLIGQKRPTYQFAKKDPSIIEYADFKTFIEQKQRDRRSKSIKSRKEL